MRSGYPRYLSAVILQRLQRFEPFERDGSPEHARLLIPRLAARANPGPAKTGREPMYPKQWHWRWFIETARAPLFAWAIDRLLYYRHQEHPAALEALSYEDVNRGLVLPYQGREM